MVQTIRHLADGSSQTGRAQWSRSAPAGRPPPAGACGSYRRAGFAARINSMPKFVASRTLD